MTMTARQRLAVHNAVVRGAKFLDEKKPEWWKRVPITGGLVMSSLRHCVLGHLYATENVILQETPFEVGCRMLGLDAESKIFRYGFDRKFGSMHFDSSAQNAGYSVLAEEWIEQIRLRTEGAL